MKNLRCMIAVAALAFTLPAQAAVVDPEVIIYRVSGVIDDNSGFATSFYCTNFSGVTETIRVVVRGGDSTLRANVPTSVAHLSTVVFSTRDVLLYATDINLNANVITVGTAA